MEFNASDSRSKKTLEQHISELLNNKTMDGYFSTSGLNGTLNYIAVCASFSTGDLRLSLSRSSV